MKNILTAREIPLRLKEIPEWRLSGIEIRRSFIFPSFLNAITFVNEIARIAESQNHHPDIDIRYDKVHLALTTHDSGGLTEKDFILADECDKLYQKLVG